MDQLYIKRKRNKWLALPSGLGANSGPRIISISPGNGPTAGGTAFTILGLNFKSGVTIKIGSISATSVVFVDSGTLTGVTPAGAAGGQDIIVTNLDGSNVTLIRGFSYDAASSFVLLEDGTIVLAEDGSKVILES